MTKWLDKYEQGGMVLKKKTKDNYGKRENANEGYSTAGPGWVGEGTTNKGFNYNGAWGGTMAMGGALPGAVGFTYARTQDPAPSNGPYAKKTKASAQDGKKMPKAYWASNDDREAYRNKLKEVATKALGDGSDENFLIETPYHQIEEGNNCISGVCGLNTVAGLKYNAPTDKDRFLGNTKFSDAVKAGKEDYYQVGSNFQIGDHIQYLNEKGAPHHSKLIYDITKNDKGDPEYHIIHNSGGTTFAENVYSEKDMKDMLSGNMPIAASSSGYSKINVYRPGYNLDKPLLDKEREAKTSPEARAALAERKNIQEWDASHNPGFDYSIRPESEYYNNQPKGMKKFIDFANDDAKVTALAKKLNVGKDIIHDQLLNTFGELGQENEWKDPLFGGDLSEGKSPIPIPFESTIEKVLTAVGGGKGWSVGPGQIKYKTLDPELKKQFGINRPKDLHDFDKVIPLMTAINVKNKKWMENQGDNLSTKLIGTPGVSADEIKYGIDRWVPYAYPGLPTDPVAAVRRNAQENAGAYKLSTKDREEYINNYIKKNIDPDKLKTFDEGSYAGRVYDLIDKNLSRTMPAQNYEQYNELMPVTVKSKKKMQNGGEMRFYQEGLDFKPKTISQNGAVLNPELFNIDTRAAQDATRNPVPRKMTAAEKKEAEEVSKKAIAAGKARDEKIIAERKTNKNTKGDLNTPGSWHTADKARLFPESVGGVGEMFDEYVNPAYTVGFLSDALGESVTARDPKGIATSLGLAAGIGALGLDPLGASLKYKNVGSKYLKNLEQQGANIQTASIGNPFRGTPAREIDDAMAPIRQDYTQYIQERNARNAAFDQRRAAIRQSNTPRAPYQAPTDDELLRLNEIEANRYASRVNRTGGQPSGTPDDMRALENEGPSTTEQQNWFHQIEQTNTIDPDFERFVGRPANTINIPINESQRATQALRETFRRQQVDQGPSLNDLMSSDSDLAMQPASYQPGSQAPVSTGPKWGEKDFKIGDARQSARHTDTEGNSFRQDVRDYGDTRSGSYKVEDPDGGYMELSTRQDLVDPNSYLEVSNMTFKNDVDASAAKQFSKIMAHLPGKVNMGHISTSMYSQPLMNQQVARWANNNAGRIEVRNVDLETLNPWHKGMDFPTDPLKGYPKYGNRLDQIKQQFPKLQKTVKSMSQSTGVDLPEPRLEFFDMSLDVPTRRPITLEELNSEVFKRKLQQDPSLGNKVTMKAPTYELIKHYRNGGQIVDSMGQWAHPGDVTTIPGNDITMKGVNYDVLGVSNTGDKKLMKPGKNYKFDGDYVTEYPKGGWLEKYK